ncbi:DUF4861 domain-containing protein [Hymenobacter ruricola]|uniref:DUF4861 domain-containing protein n=1 Tax=Hymenobacter ruricola TaxID=2791023 RepID=UPI00293D283D|nr:DUF4861 domain-containing protein [Hymenobacter ruricola]
MLRSAADTGVKPALKTPAALAFTVRNRLAVARPTETVSLPAARLSGLIKAYGAGNLLVRDAAGTVLVSQALDNNADGQPDELLFQTALGANETRKFTVSGAPNGAAARPQSPYTTFSRFVPERIDDYAWENERVAFRTYGPVAQQLTEAGRKDGTLTSGMDCWLKRVSSPVIDKWYAGYQTHPSYYHHDRGEGYDPYHVGNSRGCGGTGIWDEGRLWVSKNFVSYKTLATGPIRTVFELTYAPWQANGRTVTERKRISLDLGSNLTRYEDYCSSPQPLPNFVVGISLHEKKGAVQTDRKAGWFRYWEAVDDAEIGTGVVLDPRAVTEVRDYRVEQPDQSNLLVFMRPATGPFGFYAGFGWTKSGQFRTTQEWDAYLAQFAQRLASPVEISWAKTP